ncbi:hypothetical protein V6N11_025322 [Hibiscus sabdariffa]
MGFTTENPLVDDRSNRQWRARWRIVLSGGVDGWFAESFGGRCNDDDGGSNMVRNFEEGNGYLVQMGEMAFGEGEACEK